MEIITPRMEFIEQFDRGVVTVHFMPAYISSVTTANLCKLREELMKVHARGIERLEAPDIEDIGPDDIETDPLLRYSLHLGVGVVRRRIAEIESELKTRPDGLGMMCGIEFHNPDSTTTNTGKIAALTITDEEPLTIR